MICKQCGEIFPSSLMIEGKKRCLGSRKFCLSCSPWGLHNTKNKLKKTTSNLKVTRVCIDCGQVFDTYRNKTCGRCRTAQQRQRARDYVYEIVGHNCWVCGYGGGTEHIPMLDFHHMNPDNKVFNLNINGLTNNNRTKVLNEIKKCILVCARCHREIHHMEMINQVTLENVYIDEWRKKKF